MLLAQTETSVFTAPDLWVLGFTVFTGCLICFHMLHGWFAGLYRKIGAFMSIVCAYACAYFGGPLLGEALAQSFDYPRLLLNGFGGAAIGFVMYFLLSSLASIFLPASKDIDSLVKKMFTSMGGMIAGAVIGVIYAAALALGVQWLGSLAQMRIKYELALPPDSLAQSSHTTPSNTRTSSAQDTPATTTHKTYDLEQVKKDNRGLVFLAQLKSGLQASPLAPAVNLVDPVPAETYRVMDKVRAVAQNESALRIFKNHPASQKLFEQPLIQTLLHDQEIIQLAQQRDIDRLMRHPKILAATNDISLQEIAKAFDVEEALDEALAGAQW